mgnify:CR=1 FL=1
MMHYGNEQTNCLMLNRDQIVLLSQKLQTVSKMLENSPIKLVENFSFQIEQLATSFEEGENIKSCDWAHNLYNKQGCFVGWFFARTWVDGRMSFCCHDRVTGDLRETGFKQRWFSREYDRYRSVSKHFDESKNIDLRKNGRGGWLLADDCSWCGNYEIINRASKTLQRTGLSNYLSINN